MDLKKKIVELAAENERLKHDLMHDHLTGLKTREYFEEKMKEITLSFKNLKSEKRKEMVSNFSIIFIDIDRFKKINDNYGHNAGDVVLKKVSKIISSKVRTTDVVCRWAGDEITAILFGADENEAAEKAEEIRAAVEKGGKDTGVTISSGVVCYEARMDIDSTIKYADQAMYLAKKEGKNKVRTYSDVLRRKKSNFLE